MAGVPSAVGWELQLSVVSVHAGRAGRRDRPPGSAWRSGPSAHSRSVARCPAQRARDAREGEPVEDPVVDAGLRPDQVVGSRPLRPPRGRDSSAEVSAIGARARCPASRRTPAARAHRSRWRSAPALTRLCTGCWAAPTSAPPRPYPGHLPGGAGRRGKTPRPAHARSFIGRADRPKPADGRPRPGADCAPTAGGRPLAAGLPTGNLGCRALSGPDPTPAEVPCPARCVRSSSSTAYAPRSARPARRASTPRRAPTTSSSAASANCCAATRPCPPSASTRWPSPPPRRSATRA